MTMPAPRPAPTAAPEMAPVEPGPVWAMTGAAVSSSTTKTTASSWSAFMNPLLPYFCQSLRSRRTARPGESMLRMQCHAHEQRREEREDIRLKEGHEQLQQAQGHHTQDAEDRHRTPQRR